MRVAMEAGFGEGAGAGAGFVGKRGSVGELAGELALSMLKLQDTFFDGVLGHHPDTLTSSVWPIRCALGRWPDPVRRRSTMGRRG